MHCVVEAAEALMPQTEALVGEAPPSPAGPLEPTRPPASRCRRASTCPRALQVLRFSQRQIEFVFRARRELGDVFRMRGTIAGGPVITCHPDHVRSLFTAKPELAPSLTGESPLRPIVGPNSVLTAVGPRHMRQRKLLLPSFHGEAIERYVQMISDAAEREIDALARRRAVRARPAHAGDHARRDHGRDLRHRGHARGAARPSTACARPPSTCSPPRPGRWRSSPS